ncbi:hypothetical protein FHS85_004963 [Rhodoligotrophos appendicifer]
MNVVVFQWPWGTLAWQRSPVGARPRKRAIFAEAPVSSMKISFSGARSSWLSNQDCRAAATSLRACSAAWPVFYGMARPSRQHRAMVLVCLRGSVVADPPCRSRRTRGVFEPFERGRRLGANELPRSLVVL